MRNPWFERTHISTVLFTGIVTVSLLVLFRAQITAFGAWWLTISAKKFFALGVFYLAGIGLLVLIDRRKPILIISLFVAAMALFSAKDDVYSLRSGGDYSSNGNSYVYKNNDYLYDKDKIRAIKAISKNVGEMWGRLCAEYNSFCSDSRVSSFAKLEKTVFIVSSMFDYGNAGSNNRAQYGCVEISEDTNFKKRKLGFSSYRNSSVGCCVDFSRLTASFLNYMKIANEFVDIPGHEANRAKLDGKWVFVDSTTALIVRGLFDGAAAPKIFYIYPNAGVDMASRRFVVLNFQKQEVSEFSDNVSFIENYTHFVSSADVDARYLR